MNETIFFAHILVVIGFVLLSLRYGSSHSLIALAAVQAILANLFVVKQTELFGMTVTCSDVFSVGSILTMNLLQEFYGVEKAKIALKTSFFGLLFFAAMTQFHLLYIPSPADATHTSFLTIFSSTPRIIAASIGVFFIVQKLDIAFFGWLKSAFGGARLPQRLGISLVVSQFFDTVLFSIFGLYGIVDSVASIILISFAVKCLIIALSTPLVGFSKRFVHDAHAPS